MEIIVEMDAGRRVYNRTARVMNKVLGNYSQFRVSQNALQFILGSLFEYRLDIGARASLFRANGQVDQGNIGGGNLV